MSTQTTVHRGDLRAYEESVRLPAPELVERLRDVLGAKLVAYLGSVQETRAVRQWADPDDPRTPSTDVRAVGGRWDDRRGNFRTVYAGSTLLACLLEVLAGFRPALTFALELELDDIVEDDEDATMSHDIGSNDAEVRSSTLSAMPFFPPRIPRSMLVTLAPERDAQPASEESTRAAARV